MSNTRIVQVAGLLRQQRRGRRTGAVLVWFALMLTTLLGMVGLVIDAGLLMSTHRQVQNAADAAALAVAVDLMWGNSGTAVATATTYVQDHNGLAGAPAPVVNNPPLAGNYAGDPRYVEVIVTAPMQTSLIHILGVTADQTVSARAVAGFEAVTAGEGACALDPYHTGIKVTGTSTLRVNGLVVVNSEGKGKDENGDDVGTGENYYAATAGNNSPAFASNFHVVGGVDRPENFRNIDSGDPTNVLHCGQLPSPDPLLGLPTPTVHNGVDDTFRGEPKATKSFFSSHITLGDEGVDYGAPGPHNYIDDYTDPDNPVMVLYPGIYQSITITGGRVRLMPGIYVLKPAPNTSNPNCPFGNCHTTNPLQITGGVVEARGIMFYNTGHNYNPENGLPDANDGSNTPGWLKNQEDQGFVDPSEFGSIRINADMQFSPIDTSDPTLDYSHLSTLPEDFDGMLFYQRRLNDESLTVAGNSSGGNLAGTLYAKWAKVTITGGGTYDAQFIVGSMAIAGGAEVILTYAGQKLGKAPQVFLVE